MHFGSPSRSRCEKGNTVGHDAKLCLAHARPYNCPRVTVKKRQFYIPTRLHLSRHQLPSEYSVNSSKSFRAINLSPDWKLCRVSSLHRCKVCYEWFGLKAKCECLVEWCPQYPFRCRSVVNLFLTPSCYSITDTCRGFEPISLADQIGLSHQPIL